MYKKDREQNLEDVVYGTRAVMEAIDAGRSINKILVQQGMNGSLFRELKQKLKGTGLAYQTVPIQKLNKITRKNHQGIIAFMSPISYQDIEDIVPSIFEKGEIPLIAILDRVTDVRNFGSIARSAECNGVHAILVPSRGSAMINADAIKTSAGALHKIPVCRSFNLKHSIEQLKEFGLKVISCTEKTDTLLPQANLQGPLAFIMGSEEDGVSPAYMSMSDAKVKIPMKGTIASLNVAVSASILMYEANRQRLN